MNKVVVIGANGFIGGQLASMLAKMNYEVMALVYKDACITSLMDISNITIKQFTFDNLLDLNALGYDTIYHMAWSGVDSAHKHEAYAQVQNIEYGLKVIDFAKNSKIDRIIVPGSASEYSCGDNIIDGYGVPSPSDMYSACKVASHYVCGTYAMQNGIGLIWTNITSVYGPGRNDNNLITYVIKKLLEGEKPSTTKLEQQWDYIYIDDLIDALIAIGENGISGRTYPIGSGIHYQMMDYVKIIQQTIDPSLPIGIGEVPYKNAKIDNQIIDISSLRTDTGFEPKVTFEEGIVRTIEYLKAQLS